MPMTDDSSAKDVYFTDSESLAEYTNKCQNNKQKYKFIEIKCEIYR